MTTLQEVRARFARDQGLPFSDSLSELSILNALNAHGVQYRDRLFSPATTIWGFLSQVLSEDHSCRDAVSRIIAHRAASGLEPCSPNTASYCNARARISANAAASVARSAFLQHEADRRREPGESTEQSARGSRQQTGSTPGGGIAGDGGPRSASRPSARYP